MSSQTPRLALFPLAVISLLLLLLDFTSPHITVLCLPQSSPLASFMPDFFHCLNFSPDEGLRSLMSISTFLILSLIPKMLLSSV